MTQALIICLNNPLEICAHLRASADHQLRFLGYQVTTGPEAYEMRLSAQRILNTVHSEPIFARARSHSPDRPR